MKDIYKNELVNEWLERNYQTFSGTVDTSDFVPKRYHNWILRFIFKIMKKQTRDINRQYRRLRREQRRSEKSDVGIKENNTAEAD